MIEDFGGFVWRKWCDWFLPWGVESAAKFKERYMKHYPRATEEDLNRARWHYLMSAQMKDLQKKSLAHALQQLEGSNEKQRAHWGATAQDWREKLAKEEESYMEEPQYVRWPDDDKPRPGKIRQHVTPESK